MNKPKLAIVIGSVRSNRFAAHASDWIETIARQNGEFDVEVVDLKRFPASALRGRDVTRLRALQG